MIRTCSQFRLCTFMLSIIILLIIFCNVLFYFYIQFLYFFIPDLWLLHILKLHIFLWNQLIIFLNCYMLLWVLYDVLLDYLLQYHFCDGLSHFQVDLLLKTLLLESLNLSFCCMINFLSLLFFNFYHHYLLISITLLVLIQQTLLLFFPTNSSFIYVIAFYFFL